MLRSTWTAMRDRLSSLINSGDGPNSRSAITIQDLSPGDILLIQTRVKTPISKTGLSPQVMRQVASAQQHGYVTVQQQFLNSFTHAAIILQRKKRLFVALPTRHGIELFPAVRWLRRLEQDGTKVVVRRLQATFTDSMRHVLEEILRAAAFGCKWSQSLPNDTGSITSTPRGHTFGTISSTESPATTTNNSHLQSNGYTITHSHTKSSLSTVSYKSEHSRDYSQESLPVSGIVSSKHTKRKDVSDIIPPLTIERPPSMTSSHSNDTSTVQLSARTDLTSFAKNFLRLLLPRIWAAASRIPPHMQVELRRAFRRIDMEGKNHISVNKLSDILSDMYGTNYNEHSTQEFYTLMKTCPGVSRGGIAGVAITEKDILLTLARHIAGQAISAHDLDGIVCGEFIATIYEMMGLLPMRQIEQVMNDKYTPSDLKHVFTQADLDNDEENDAKITSNIVTTGLQLSKAKRGQIFPVDDTTIDAVERNLIKKQLRKQNASTMWENDIHEEEEEKEEKQDGSFVEGENEETVSNEWDISGADMFHVKNRRKTLSDMGRSQKSLSTKVRELKAAHIETVKEARQRDAIRLELQQQREREQQRKRATEKARAEVHRGAASAKRKAYTKRYAGSIVVLEDTQISPDFAHFVPMTFCSKHKPPLRLLRGHLKLETFISVSEQDEFTEQDAHRYHKRSAQPSSPQATIVSVHRNTLR